MADSQTVAILGASADPERYSYKAQRLLKQYGHKVIPISLKEVSLDGDLVAGKLAEIETPVDTLTMYVRPALSTPIREDIERLRPGRVIFNPGTENPDLAAALNKVGIATEEACTLVLLRTGQF